MGILSKLSQYNKAIIALVMAIAATLVNFGVIDAVPSFLTEESLTSVITFLGSIFVFAVPNAAPEEG